jgi:hypothetical protein
MKRQHPDNPELFWCPKCKTYKARGEFGGKDKIDGWCKRCRAAAENRRRKCYDRDKLKTYHKEYYEKHKEEIKKQCLSYITRRPEVKKKAYDNYRKRHADEIKERLKTYRIENRAAILASGRRSAKNAYWNNPVKYRNITKEATEKMCDSYITASLRKSKFDITPETIELKRQQIIMKRTLKQFKEWRKQYEPNNPDVQREQRENEETDGRQGHGEP